MNPAAAHLAPLRLPAWRSRAVLLSLLLAFGVLAARAIYLQGLHNSFLQRKGESRYGRVIELPATRGIITDRNREPLAISTPVESVWASAADIDIT
ncbi:MAG TPA: penicillin-binding protein 2, partial [Burkholderiales bacterium]|nr:penicillin-binding protein 2 [Burkholderiales bacterium]